MKRSPLPIIREYLQSDNPQIRRNAVASLAVLPAQNESIELLLNAVNDPDTTNQSEAISTLHDVLSDWEKKITTVVDERLASHENRMSTYVLLGRLCRNGVRISTLHYPILKRLSLAWRVRREVSYKQIWNTIKRSIIPAFFGTLIGAVIFLIYLAYVLTGEQAGTGIFELIEPMMGIIIYSPIILPIVAMMSISFGHYCDRMAGLITETIRAIIGGLVMSTLIFVLIYYIEWIDSPLVNNVQLWIFEQVPYLLLALAFMFIVGSIRLGTIFGNYVPFKQINLRSAVVITGSAFGWVMLIIAYIVLHNGPIETSLLSIFSFTMIPQIVGMANIWAKLDAELISQREVYPARLKIVAVTPIVLVIIISVVILVPSAHVVEQTAERFEQSISKGQQSEHQIIAESGAMFEDELVIKLGEEQWFAVNFPQQISIAVLNEDVTIGNDYVIIMRSPNNVETEADDPPSITVDLKQLGSYSFIVTEYSESYADELTMENVFPVLARRFLHSDLDSPVKLVNVSMKLNLNLSSKHENSTINE